MGAGALFLIRGAVEDREAIVAAEIQRVRKTKGEEYDRARSRGALSLESGVAAGTGRRQGFVVSADGPC